MYTNDREVMSKQLYDIEVLRKNFHLTKDIESILLVYYR